MHHSIYSTSNIQEKDCTLNLDLHPSFETHFSNTMSHESENSYLLVKRKLKVLVKFQYGLCMYVGSCKTKHPMGSRVISL